MKLAIFSEIPTAYSPLRLQKEAAEVGVEVGLYGYLELDFLFKKGETRVLKGGKDFPSYDLVIFRSLRQDFFAQRDFLLGFFKKQKVLNRLSFEMWPRLEQDKFTQHAVLVEAGLPIAETKSYGNAAEALGRTNDFPVVAKAFRGSHGSNVFKIEDKSKLEEVLGRFEASALLVQEVLPEGQDLRVIVIGGRAIGAMKRRAKPGNFVSNYSAGGSIENYFLDKDPVAERLAIRAAGAFHLEFGGIDLMKDNRGIWRVLEVNRACQFEGFEKATGVNVAGEIINYLKRKR